MQGELFPDAPALQRKRKRGCNTVTDGEHMQTVKVHLPPRVLERATAQAMKTHGGNLSAWFRDVVIRALDGEPINRLE